jgi:penicillin-binding protein 1A
VTLLEMAGAYAAFSNGGHVVTPHVITRITTESGRVLFAYQPPAIAQPIAEAGRIGALNDMLNGAVVYGTGKRAALSDRPAAGKTGTTQDFRDAWFIGYTAQLTAGVWVGNDNGKPMNRATGGSLPADIWRQVMRAAHEGLPPQVLPGTVASNSEIEASIWGALATSSHLPRVVEAKETLPGQRAANAEPERYLPERPFGSAQRSSHPRDGIGDDFIEKALATTPDNDKPPAHVAAQDAPAAPSGGYPFSKWW